MRNSDVCNSTSAACTSRSSTRRVSCAARCPVFALPHCLRAEAQPGRCGPLGSETSLNAGNTQPVPWCVSARPTGCGTASVARGKLTGGTACTARACVGRRARDRAAPSAAGRRKQLGARAATVACCPSPARTVDDAAGFKHRARCRRVQRLQQRLRVQGQRRNATRSHVAVTARACAGALCQHRPVLVLHSPDRTSTMWQARLADTS